MLCLTHLLLATSLSGFWGEGTRRAKTSSLNLPKATAQPPITNSPLSYSPQYERHVGYPHACTVHACGYARSAGTAGVTECCRECHLVCLGDESQQSLVHGQQPDSSLTTNTMLPCKARALGAPTAKHSGRTELSKPSGAELLLCSQAVHSRQEAKQGQVEKQLFSQFEHHPAKGGGGREHDGGRILAPNIQVRLNTGGSRLSI